MKKLVLCILTIISISKAFSYYDLISIMNDYRFQNGKLPLKQDVQLDMATSKMAEIYANEGSLDNDMISKSLSDVKLNITSFTTTYIDGFNSSDSLVKLCLPYNDFLANYDYASVGVYSVGDYNYVVTAAFKEIDYDEEVDKVYDLITYNRNNNGAITKLRRDKNLERMAMARAKELFENYSHTRPNGKEFYTIMEDLNIKNYWNGNGENIAYGYKDAKDVMKAWMESTGHRENILDKRYTSVGVGLYIKNGLAYWVQIFGIDNPKYKDNNTKYHKKDNEYNTYNQYDSYQDYDEYEDNYKNDSLY